MARQSFSQPNNATKSLKARTSVVLLVVNGTLALLHFGLLAFWFETGNIYLYAILITGQIFYLWQTFTFIYTVWGIKDETDQPITKLFFPKVDVFIPVAGEPAGVVEETLKGALAMHYPRFKIFILNDGYVAGKENWREIEELALRYGVACITRKIPGGAKAGNINHALKETTSNFIAVFDADHVPHVDFLKVTMPYFADWKVGFVQTPQYYKNHKQNLVTGAAWEQQELFFGAICRGKNRQNSAIMCGTNMVLRRTAIEEIGGMVINNVAEDVVTGMLIHEHGWKSVYIPKVLAEGLAPQDFLSYYNQQLRWARGSIELLFKRNPLLQKGLTLAQKIQYLASATFYFSGVAFLLSALIPIFYFYTGLVPFVISTVSLAIIFIPYIFLTLYNLQNASNFSYTFRALAFSLSSWSIHVQALLEYLFKKRGGFVITSKTQIYGNFLYLVVPHMAYIALVVIGIGVGILREGISASFITNTAWAFIYIALFTPFIKAAAPEHVSLPVAEIPREESIELSPQPQKEHIL
ncbi:MAG: glycosyltransferase [Candidatus Wildermuthbacteria bacterium]|nr:glycosyltransferase [Candidatus Wildermuthbacteria bacterium]